jgi:general L-amino acid transport system permease protein
VQRLIAAKGQPYMTTIDTGQSTAPRTSFLNDPVIRGIIYQVVVAVLLVGFILWIIGNTAANLAAQNKTTGFDFLWRTAGFDISFSLLPWSRASYYWEAFLVGLLNTLLVAVIGIFFATLLGFTIGIARLSTNFIVSSLATVYIEVIRNIPLLLQLFFWYFAVLKAMPAVRESLQLPFDSFINQRGIMVPRPIPDEQFSFVWLGLLVAIVAVIALRYWAKKRLEATGQRFPVFLTSVAILVGVTALTFVVSGASVTFEPPVLERFNFRGGLQLPPEFVALAFGLTIYTASFIAETVRAGILAVNRGQTEAAQSLGLKENDRLRLVIVPQAMRVIVPPLTSQYLNLTKNSSLGAAIGYPELVNVFAGTSLNQTGRAIECIAITMAVYLILSLLTSAIMNWYNGRVRLVER